MYTFSFRPSRCCWPGLNVTCDTRHQPPRPLLGDLTSLGCNALPEFCRGFREHGYLLSARNEFVVSARCNVTATISTDIIGEERRNDQDPQRMWLLYQERLRCRLHKRPPLGHRQVLQRHVGLLPGAPHFRQRARA